ncbi:PadR family transcriptional regulator [Parafrankia colletiae]|uniref:PadR family transcriptional regulator n=1 Tax=Parafrankia colletiae TaxID=573497 RepID=A0A1S1QP49_9ACTN|nr:helix-turn-helix transcriptional regulator [Parafrankia colletiae]MCK9901858.1 PadR family transcriptional regulator [Frankia sp. Cpl3]OHV36518.1 PadR family transcriptional regulator [Parafrankia colletiae]
MAGLSRVTPATLDVLEVLLNGEVEPYGLAIAKRAGLATGSVFPILARLERLAWITSNWEETDRPGPRRRLYGFTPEGMAGARVLLAERRGRGAGQRRGLGGFSSAPEGAR